MNIAVLSVFAISLLVMSLAFSRKRPAWAGALFFLLGTLPLAVHATMSGFFAQEPGGNYVSAVTVSLVLFALAAGNGVAMVPDPGTEKFLRGESAGIAASGDRAFAIAIASSFLAYGAAYFAVSIVIG